MPGEILNVFSFFGEKALRKSSKVRSFFRENILLLKMKEILTSSLFFYIMHALCKK